MEYSSSPSAKSNQSQNSPNKGGRIYINYKSKDQILAETSPQSTNLYEKSKKDRQQMERLNQVMLNRVQLLQSQDEKLNKKISEQKNYATSISWNKSRVEQEKLEKEQRKKEAQQELMLKREKVQQQKAEQQQKNLIAKQIIFQQKCNETKQIKLQTLENQNQIQQQNREYVDSNIIKKMAIQQDYAEGNEKIKQFYYQRKLEVQQQIQNMVNMELEQRMQLEEQFKQLEEEEFKQLQKLKNTKEAEKHVANELENVKSVSPSKKKQNYDYQFDQSPNSNGEFTDPTLITNQVLLEEHKEETNQQANDQ